MRSVYLTGLRIALRRWPLVLVLFVAHLACGLIFAALTWSWLSLALDESLASRTLLTDLDLNVFVDLFAHHGDSSHMLLSGGVVLAGVCVLLGVWGNAVTVTAVAEDFSFATCLHRGLDMYLAYLQLWFLANLLNAASVGAAFFIGRGLLRWTAESRVEMAAYAAGAAAVGVGALLLLFFVTVHDHARIRCSLSGTGAARAYIWALGYVARGEWRALPLAAGLCATGFLVWLSYQTVGMLLTTHSAGGVALSLLWGQALLLSRMLLRVWCFAAETELQSLSAS